MSLKPLKKSQPQQLPRPLWQVTASITSFSILLMTLIPYAQPPQWWADKNIIDPDKAENNNAVANIGQAKHVFQQTADTLNAILPSAESVDLSDRIPAKPAAPDAAWFKQQKTAVNLGQLKHLITPIYDRLSSIAPQWLADQMIQNGIQTWAVDQQYPWNPDTPLAQNYAVANIGQLKFLASLRFNQDKDGLSGAGDGIPDLLEWYYINQNPNDSATHPDNFHPNDDLDGDNISNLDEITAGTNPNGGNGSEGDGSGETDPGAESSSNPVLKSKPKPSFAVIEVDENGGYAQALHKSGTMIYRKIEPYGDRVFLDFKNGQTQEIPYVQNDKTHYSISGEGKLVTYDDCQLTVAETNTQSIQALLNTASAKNQISFGSRTYQVSQDCSEHRLQDVMVQGDEIHLEINLVFDREGDNLNKSLETYRIFKNGQFQREFVQDISYIDFREDNDGYAYYESHEDYDTLIKANQNGSLFYREIRRNALGRIHSNSWNNENIYNLFDDIAYYNDSPWTEFIDVPNELLSNGQWLYDLRNFFTSIELYQSEADNLFYYLNGLKVSETPLEHNHVHLTEEDAPHLIAMKQFSEEENDTNNILVWKPGESDSHPLKQWILDDSNPENPIWTSEVIQGTPLAVEDEMKTLIYTDLVTGKTMHWSRYDSPDLGLKKDPNFSTDTPYTGMVHPIEDISLPEGYELKYFNKMASNGLMAASLIKTSNTKNTLALLLPVEIAPDVLAVNSDFDEGRVKPLEGTPYFYAIPDCDDMEEGIDPKTAAGNTELLIGAQRDHLDGEYSQGELITDDMHKGWFGVNPNQLGDDFGDGANVTIRKVDKIDPDTGRQESGQIRFYAKWGEGNGDFYGIIPYDLQTLAPNNLVTSGVNKRAGEGVYGSTSTIPDNAEFWMEGVRPGKITLEWRLQKGDIDVKHEQTFLVATQKSKQEWIDEVYYQLKLQTSIPGYPPTLDFTQYDPGQGFFEFSSGIPGINHHYIREIYYYYRQLFIEKPEEFYWAGMAKVAGASVYGGMADLLIWKDAQETIEGRAVAALVSLDSNYLTFNGGTEIFLDDFLVTGNKEIFLDQGWAHHAYAASGIWAIQHVEEIEGEGQPNGLSDLQGWEEVDDGIWNGNAASLRSGNQKFLRREQEVVMQQYYDFVNVLKLRPPPLGNLVGAVDVLKDADGLVNAGEWMSANATKNPVPGGLALRDGHPTRRLDIFADRWAWIDNGTNGMLQRWLGTSSAGPNFNAGERARRNRQRLSDAALPYTFTDGITLPAEL